MAATVLAPDTGPHRPPATPRTRAERTRETENRILAAALDSFGTAGYEATSLDALAAGLGLSKQAILYHWPSKAALLDAVIDRACLDLIVEFDGVLTEAGVGWARIDAVVRTVFRVALRRPELLGFLRELTRLGGDASARILRDLEPFVARARGYLAREMDAGRIRRCDPGLLFVSAYATVLGAATEVEVLRAVGVEPTLRSTVVRRRELLAFLRAAMVVEPIP
ncbi:MAG: TetR/AcrR family transcriptional regulator, partial [Acidobacteria bacterium]|nr:TetR/AcrR family transcriptional regulator [Acidobacteriota bacterium]